MAEVGEEAVCTSIIVAVELHFGAENSGSDKLVDRVDLILSAIEILPLESPADRSMESYANIWYAREYS